MHYGRIPRDHRGRAGVSARPRIPAIFLSLTITLAIIAAAGFLPAPGTARAEDGSPPSIDAFLSEHIRNHRLPGGALAVARSDGGVQIYARGNAGEDRPMTPDTPLYIASISKTFTAVATMQLAERGMLDLDDTVEEYLPGFSVAGSQGSGAITLRHLLTHTSGLSERDLGETPRARVEVAEAAAALGEVTPTAEPGERFIYFNRGYTLLGAVIEEVSGLSYGDYLELNILEPLGMDSTFTDPTQAAEAGLATGHGSLFGWPIAREQEFLQYAVPAGFIISTARDMGRYSAALLAGGSFGEATILSPESVEALWTDTGGDVPYALGWMLSEVGDERVVSHGGSLENYASQLVLLPDRGVGAVVLFNGNHLLYNTTSHAGLVEDMALVLTGQSPGEGTSTGMVGAILLFIFLVVAGLSLRSVIRLVGWRREVADAPRARVMRDILVPTVLSIATLSLVPVALGAITDQNIPWSLFYLGAPDLALIILVPAITALSVGVFRLVGYLSARVPVRSDMTS